MHLHQCADDLRCRTVALIAALNPVTFDSGNRGENDRNIGFADRNGVVRDLEGNIIGQMRPDGTVVDKNGKIDLLYRPIQRFFIN